MNLRMRDIIFPLTLVAFEAVGVQYWQIIFNDKTRWLLLAILFLWLCLCRRPSAAFRGASAAILSAYLLWCISTTVWSEVPQLSLMKSLALLITVLTLFSAGYDWTLRHGHEASYGFCLPIVALALFAGLFNSGGVTQAGTITIYQGLSGNPNYLGSITAMSFPCALWLSYNSKAGTLWRLISFGVIAALALVLWRSGSRASTLAMLTIVVCFVMTLSLRRRVMVAGLIGLVALGATAALPAFQTSLYERFIVKGNMNEDGSILYTRQEVWSESYELAIQGGWVGGGYGVSIGDTSGFSGGLTAVGYGREKGNSQLAVWEETGLIGLALYAALIVAVIFELGSGLLKIRDREGKAQLALLFGSVLGFTIQSIFEAWWVAPGSPECAFFWATTGAAYGTLRRWNASARQRQRGRTRFAVNALALKGEL